MITQNNIQTITGAKAIIETLKSFDVDTIFGYPGGVVLDLYDELFKDKTVKHILMRHEQSAVHAAEGYARETGKCGIVLVTSGPGATNTITGIMNAYMDGYPLIILTGQVSKNVLGTDAFQEANICDMVKTCTKASFQITSAQEIPSVFNKAFNIAQSGKKGPVVIDLVKDIFKQKIKYVQNSIHFEDIQKSKNEVNIEELISAIESSERPIIVSGGGVKHSKAEDDLLKIANEYNIPVVTTMMGVGTFPQLNKNYLGMIGIFGNKSANTLLEKSDLVISLGARFNDRISNRKAVENKLFQIDINPDEISKNIHAKNYIVGDIKKVLSQLKIKKEFTQWNCYAQQLKNENIERTKTTNMLHSFEVIRELEKCSQDKDVTFTSEVGQHQLWAVQNLNLYKDRKILVSGGLGTMGFGLPAGIGAAIANPQKTIVCITGDGSFQMSLHELATCKENNLNIKILILNNGYLGMVRQLQEKQCERRYSQTKISNPDFVTLAKSYGIDAVRANNILEVKSALRKAFYSNKTFIIDCAIEPMEVL